MKWVAFLFLRGITVLGPFDDRAACIRALDEAVAAPVMDQGFDGAVPSGMCMQIEAFRTGAPYK
jgi:hypothetical protein